MSNEPAAPPPAPASAAPETPWGLPEAAGAVVITLVTQIIGENILFLLGVNVRNPTTTESILIYQFLALGVVLSAVLLIVLRFHVPPAALGFRFPGWDALLRAAAAVLPIYGGVLLIYALFTTVLPGYHLRGNAQDLFQGLPRHPGIGMVLLVLAWTTLEAPLVEETLFRGIIFQGLRHFFGHWLPYGYAVFAGAVVSGFIFGLAHVSDPHTWPILIFLGIALAYVFQLTRSVYASALVHALINGFATLVYFFGQ